MAALDFPNAPTVGELYPVPIVAGVPQYKWDGVAWITAETPAELTYVKRAGDTMAGHLSLPTGPAAADAVRKDYVDAADATLNTAISTAGSGKVDKAGGAGAVMSGDLTMTRAAVPSTGQILFGNSGNKTLFFDGAAFNFIGGGITTGGNNTFNGTGIFTNDVTVTRGQQGAPLHGLLFMGNSGKYFFMDGTYFNCVGGGIIAPNGYKPGGGPWEASSDARIKNVSGDYQRGLDAVAALHPVIYTYKGNDTTGVPDVAAHEQGEGTKQGLTAPYPNSMHYDAAVNDTEFAGLIAQEVEAIFPEMVKPHDGYIDGQPVTDLRGLDTGPLVFALINAVKELKARVEQLENPT